MTKFNPFDDIDPLETSEWLESMDSVLKHHGPERAHFLLNRVIDFARRSGAYLPYSPNTAYLNTIATDRQPEYPGDRQLERRIRGLYPLERDGDGREGQPIEHGIRWPPVQLCVVGDPCTRSASTILARR